MYGGYGKSEAVGVTGAWDEAVVETEQLGDGGGSVSDEAGREKMLRREGRSLGAGYSPRSRSRSSSSSSSFFSRSFRARRSSSRRCRSYCEARGMYGMNSSTSSCASSSWKSKNPERRVGCEYGWTAGVVGVGVGVGGSVVVWVDRARTVGAGVRWVVSGVGVGIGVDVGAARRTWRLNLSSSRRGPAAFPLSSRRALVLKVIGGRVVEGEERNGDVARPRGKRGEFSVLCTAAPPRPPFSFPFSLSLSLPSGSCSCP